MLLHKTGRHYDSEQVLEIYSTKGGYNFRDKSRHLCGNCSSGVDFHMGLNPGDTVLYQYDSGNYSYISDRAFEEDR